MGHCYRNQERKIYICDPTDSSQRSVKLLLTEVASYNAVSIYIPLDSQSDLLNHCIWLAWNTVPVTPTQYMWRSYDNFIFLFLWNILTV